MEIYFKTSDHSSGHCHALYHLWIFQSKRNNFRGLSQKVSRQIVTVCDTLFHQDLAEETIEHYIRKKSNILCSKAAHATEYLILTLLAALPLYTYVFVEKNCFWLYFYSVSSAHPGTIPPVLYSRRSPRLQMYL